MDREEALPDGEKKAELFPLQPMQFALEFELVRELFEAKLFDFCADGLKSEDRDELAELAEPLGPQVGQLAEDCEGPQPGHEAPEVPPLELTLLLPKKLLLLNELMLLMAMLISLNTLN